MSRIESSPTGCKEESFFNSSQNQHPNKHHPVVECKDNPDK